MKPFLAILKKELRSVVEERTIMIAITIQLFVASFASVLVVGLVAFYDPNSIAQNARIAIEAGVVGDRDGTLTSILRQSNVRVTHYSSLQEARVAVEEGLVDAGLFIPVDAAEGSGIIQGQLLLPKSDSLSTVISMVLQPSLKGYENHLRQERGVDVRYTDVTGRPSTTYEFRYTVVVPILMLFPAFVAGSMVVDSISEEYETRTMEMLRTAPVSMGTILGGKIAAGLVLAVVQCVLWLVLLRVNGTRVQRPLLVVLLGSIVAADVSMGSALIAILFRERERAQFVYSVGIPLVAGTLYLLGLSPTTMIARLATGDAYTGIVDLWVFALPLLLMIGVLFWGIERSSPLRQSAS
jgi:ABC-type Na+ efflux pump permease subunit